MVLERSSFLKASRTCSKIGTLDFVISRDKMLASQANYKLWKTTMEHVFEKEDLWDCIETMDNKDEENVSSNILSGRRGKKPTKETEFWQYAKNWRFNARGREDIGHSHIVINKGIVRFHCQSEGSQGNMEETRRYVPNL